MDFFQAQEAARRQSRRLVLWFALCVAGVVLAVYALAVPLMWFADNYDRVPGSGPDWRDPGLFLTVTLVIGGTIVLGSLVKLSKLAGGGAVVARDLGGRQVDPSTTDRHERRLMNVVEEMAIASGLPVPGVWVLDDERGINAFAAGTDPANAVIGATRGCIERLSREELQGVVAHEFSHILNGDMRLNMRLAGWIFGLVMVAMLGRMLLQMLRFSGGSSRRGNGGGGAILFIGLIGVLVWLVGSIGGFFARWLQAGVSRQREYLADASAVQFTRNPSGLAGALRKVGGFSKGGTLSSPAAAEARHFFFARSDLLEFGFATHPPLDRRIKAIDPSWDGKMASSGAGGGGGGGNPEFSPDFGAALAGAGTSQPPPLSRVAGFAPDAVGDSGRLDAGVGAAMVARFSGGNAVVRSKDDAKALLFGLLLAQQDDGDHHAGLAILNNRESPQMAAQADVWHGSLREWDSASKIALMDLSLPWLKRMGRDEASDFIETNRALIEADGQVSLFEFMLEKVIERHVAIGTGLRQPPQMRHRSLAAVEQETAVLIGAFAALDSGSASDARARTEYREHTGRELPRLSAGECSLAAVADALATLDAATPLVKSALLRMSGLVVTADGRVDDVEIELLRAVAEAIGVPIPPFVMMHVSEDAAALARGAAR